MNPKPSMTGVITVEVVTVITIITTEIVTEEITIVEELMTMATVTEVATIDGGMETGITVEAEIATMDVDTVTITAMIAEITAMAIVMAEIVMKATVAITEVVLTDSLDEVTGATKHQEMICGKCNFFIIDSINKKAK